MKTGRVVSFGEIMLRLAPPGFERFLQSPQFVATFGGGEANVAVALAALGIESSYVTVLPEKNPMADATIGELRRFGVDTSYIVARQRPDGNLFPGGRGEPAAIARGLRSRGKFHRNRRAGSDRLGRGVSRGRVFSSHRNYSGDQRVGSGARDGSIAGCARGWRDRLAGSQLSQESLEVGQATLTR